ncbi:right-handed parallel beta-helix repeat-containing protein [Catenuloplanes japonicus]|uniref:right-handed parallel beta-helix repeat-containing protein n=1 Tax=Catenuloplanes japonicus TaxID=33876 RepID=UPI000B2B6537|nr:right-handed parallel beta-helix repeat-containing protein [Catenuloplanes japonicus]
MTPKTPGVWLGGAAVGISLIALVAALHGGADGTPVAAPSGTTAVPEPISTADPLATGPVGTGAGSGTGTAPAAANCPAPTVTDAAGLTAALAAATPGTVISLRDGVYEGRFVATTPGTADAPITLCGGAGAVLDGGGVKKGYGLHLNGASHWRVQGFTVRNAQKGVMADGVSGTTIAGLTVEQIGDEAVHLRKFSSDNVVEGNTIRGTGQRKPQFGEGVYIGTAESNWCEITACAPDTSDRNVVRDNTITAVTAENIDVKEGTTGGIIAGNTFDGGALSGGNADSWVDVKGNGYTISGNTGTNSGLDGFQTHVVVDGWGKGNVFTRNVAHVNGPGYGFHLTPVEDNRVACDNEVTGAAQGTSNTPCS